MGTTLSVRENSQADQPGVPHLYVVFNANQPRSSSWRHRLEGVGEVFLGRGGEAKARRQAQRLELQLADRWMSSEHARISRAGRAWRIEDLGAKNGLFVNGAAVKQADLTDGDVIELGHSFLVFREKQPDLGGAPDAASPPAGELATMQPALLQMFAQLERVAPAELPVLISGETGTGKELVARAVHRLSRRGGPFLAVNCGALPKTLIESELFGFRKGAFSGANEDRSGLVRAAENGTLFLDEIAELPPAAQAALLRVLQEREVLPIGATRAVAVDVRLVAATHRDLETLVAAGEFRSDLLARLSGFSARLPALCERREDLGILIAALLDRAQAPKETTFALLAARGLFQRRWRRNVRELERSVQAAVLLARGRPIEPADLQLPPDAPPEIIAGRTASQPGGQLGRDERRKRELLVLVEEHQGNVAAMARALGKAREQVHRWLKRYGINPDHYRR